MCVCVCVGLGVWVCVCVVELTRDLIFLNSGCCYECTRKQWYGKCYTHLTAVFSHKLLSDDVTSRTRSTTGYRVVRYMWVKCGDGAWGEGRKKNEGSGQKCSSSIP